MTSTAEARAPAAEAGGADPQPGAWLARHLDHVAAAAPDLHLLHHAAWRLSGNDGPDLPWSDWIALSAALLAFRPTLILELGRGIGSSTSLFQYWNRKALGCEVVSLCITDHWQSTTRPHLESVMPVGWTAGLEARIGDILDQDYPAIVGGHARVLVFWDAHGLAIADVVLSRILPLLESRGNLVVAHDMRDDRYFPDPGDDPAWRRSGTVFSTFEQIGPLCGYCAARGIPLVSPSHAIRQALGAGQMARLSAAERFDGICYWHCFSARRAGLAAHP